MTRELAWWRKRLQKFKPLNPSSSLENLWLELWLKLQNNNRPKINIGKKKAREKLGLLCDASHAYNKKTHRSGNNLLAPEYNIGYKRRTASSICRHTQNAPRRVITFSSFTSWGLTPPRRGRARSRKPEELTSNPQLSQALADTSPFNLWASCRKAIQCRCRQKARSQRQGVLASLSPLYNLMVYLTTTRKKGGSVSRSRYGLDPSKNTSV